MPELIDEVADKVVLDEDSVARTYDRVGVEVAIFDDTPDSSNETLASDCLVEFENPVHLVRDHRNGFTDILGSAVLYREGKSLLADIFLRYDSPERLAIESGSKIYPSIGGTVLRRQDSALQIIRISHVSLDMARNADKRIDPL